MSKQWGHGFFSAATRQVPMGVEGGVLRWLDMNWGSANDWFEQGVFNAVTNWLETGKGNELMNPMTNTELQTAINDTFKLIERSAKIECGEAITDGLDKHLESLLAIQRNRGALLTAGCETPIN